MLDLILEIVGYLGAAALIGIFLGYLIWGWGQRERIATARADGAARVRTSVDGGAGLEQKVSSLTAERDRLSASVSSLKDEIQTLRSEQPTPAQDSGKSDDKAPEDETASSSFGRLTLTSVPVAEQTEDDDATPPATATETTESDAADRPIGDITKLSAEEIDDADGLDAIIEVIDDEGDSPDDQPPDTSRQQDEIDEAIDAVLGAVRRDQAPDPQNGGVTMGTKGPGFSDAASAFFSSPPAEIDDLKMIRGVGKKMEGLLNDKGVYQFRQIAKFSEDDINWLNRAIEAFPGRIRRDNWIGQAETLHREKYGESD